MQLSHACSSMSAVFDEPNLVVSAGLVPALALADSVGVARARPERLTVPGPAGANAGLKVMSPGRRDGSPAPTRSTTWGCCGTAPPGSCSAGIRAPSTLGTFLRAFTFGHVKQLDAVASRTLVGLQERAGLLPGIDAELPDRHRRHHRGRRPGLSAGEGYRLHRCR